MSRLNDLLNRAGRIFDLTPPEYVIAKKVHPILKSSAGYYALHPDKVWHWVKDRERATTFRSYDLAQHAVVGSQIQVYYYYEIERI